METRLTLRPGQPGTRQLVAIWRQAQRLWEITYRDSKNLGIEGRIVEGGAGKTIHSKSPAHSIPKHTRSPDPLRGSVQLIVSVMHTPHDGYDPVR